MRSKKKKTPIAICGNIFHIVGLKKRWKRNKPRWREPQKQGPTKVLSPQGQAQPEIPTKTVQSK